MILFTAAWRLFFPAAALFAGLAIPLWLLLNRGAAGPIADAFAWHRHEMLFGYLPAALAGFLFTAIPNWTGRPGLKPAALVALFALWLAGRAAMFLSGAEPGIAASVVTLAFLPAIALLTAREIIASGNRRNLVVAGLVAALAAAQAWFLFVDAEQGGAAGIAVALVLMTLIGGRVTPAFTRNWLHARGETRLPAAFGPVDKLALAATAATGLGLALTGLSTLTAGLAALATLALAARLSRWRGLRVIAEPLLLAQHAAYAWLPVGTGLMALAILTGLASAGQAFHALGAGAVGSMTVIVMLRAVLGHSGRPIEGRAIDWALLVAIHAGALLRVTSAWFGDPAGLVDAAGTLWALGMLLFAIRTLPIALTPRL